MHILVTGHTGFKGSWLSLMASLAGHQVSGLSLSADKQSLFIKSDLSKLFESDLVIDVRDRNAVKNAIRQISPDFIIHLAAQSLVKQSYIDPIETFEVNVMGTWHILESIQSVESVKSAIIVTTDKVYLNNNAGFPFKESSPLGAADPYSTSKAAADLLTQSWLKSYKEKPIAIARAGNVIGGGDIANHRLIPDILKAHHDKSQLKIRYPEATRPWQHVLDCVNGYLTLMEFSNNADFSAEWNFGPNDSDEISVKDVINKVMSNLDFSIDILQDNSIIQPEANRLALDSNKSLRKLKWHRKLDAFEAIDWTTDFYKRVSSGEKYLNVMVNQVNMFNSIKFK
jgi:CDP-glucose 4,6-dehydratase